MELVKSHVESSPDSAEREPSDDRRGEAKVWMIEAAATMQVRLLLSAGTALRRLRCGESCLRKLPRSHPKARVRRSRWRRALYLADVAIQGVR